ncbi:MAG: response regulator [Cytophaga sp.]|uniref:response regulator n=1 Tax=Cytophaga sp. TaxID=29535 RepID=UPI003F823736
METKILIIDDSADDYTFFERSLHNSGIQAQIISAQDGLAGFEEAAKGGVDCIFLDYHLPKMNGLEVLRKIRSEGIDTPVIMLTGQKDEHTIVQLLKDGANDYISKSDLSPEVLRFSFETSRQMYQMRKEKEAAVSALKESQLRLSEAQEIAALGNWEYDAETKELYISEQAQTILDYKFERSRFPMHAFIRHQVHPEHIGTLIHFIRNLKKDDYYEITLRIKTFENVYKYVHLKKRREGTFHSTNTKITGTIQDITILKKALDETKKAKISRKATTLVLTIGICIFLVSEAIIDPFVDALQIGFIIAISFKGGIALFLKPLESMLERIMLKKVATA